MNRRLFFRLLSLVFLFSACHNAAEKDRQGSRPLVDTQVKEVYRTISHDHQTDTNRVMGPTRGHPSVDTDSENPSGKLSDIFDGYVSQYRKPVLVDTFFNIGPDIFHLALKYYCLMDSAIVVPGKYVEMYKLDSFVTHNFETRLRLEKNKKTILETRIQKKDFEKLIYPELKAYAVLYSPEIQLSDDVLKLEFSISIPLTDVGIGVSAVIKPNGEIVYKTN